MIKETPSRKEMLKEKSEIVTNMKFIQPFLFLEVTTFCCSIIFFMFHLSNKLRTKEIVINPNETKSKIRDMKLDDILNGTHKVTQSSIKRVYTSALNKHFVIPYCGWISFISFVLFILLTYLEIKHII